MPTNESSQAALQVIPTATDHLEALSRLLGDGLQIPEYQRRNYSSEALRWKYFEPRGPWAGPRSFVVEGGGQLSAHIGATTTELVTAGEAGPVVTAVHPVDWLSTQQGGMLGAMLMLKMFSRGAVQYSLGSTASGNSVLLGCGFQKLGNVPAFYRVFRPGRPAVWRMVHGSQKLPKKIALLAVDLARSVWHPPSGNGEPAVQLQRVEQFPEDMAALVSGCRMRFICSSRAPALLNYFLRAPGGTVSGWLLKQGDRRLGFALTSITLREGIRLGNVVDCFLTEADPAYWNSAVHGLTKELALGGCDVARMVCSAPWLHAALRANGYFQRGGGVFFLRDPGKLVPRDRPFHLTLLEGDMGY